MLSQESIGPAITQLDLTSSNLDDSKFEVHDIKPVSSIT